MKAIRKVIYIKRYKIKWGQLITQLFGVGVLITVPKWFSMIVYIMYGKLEFIKQLLGYDEELGVYLLLTKLKSMDKGDIYLKILMIFCALSFVLAIIFQLKQFRKRKLLIIEHISLQKMVFKYSSLELAEYAEKKYKINQYDILNQSTGAIDVIVKKLIIDIKNHIEKIRIYIDKGYQVGYAGIANIPAIFYLGYELGDENGHLLFHKKRGSSSDDIFHLMNVSENNYLYNFVGTQLNDDSKKDYEKILLVIELTQPISSNDFESLIEEKDLIFKYSISGTVDYDVVDNSIQADKYTNKILKEIAKFQKKYPIREIKICVAASSSFVFLLGSKFSKTQNVNTVIYHFQNRSYPWGINVTDGLPVIGMIGNRKETVE